MPPSRPRQPPIIVGKQETSSAKCAFGDAKNKTIHIGQNQQIHLRSEFASQYHMARRMRQICRNSLRTAATCPAGTGSARVGSSGNRYPAGRFTSRGHIHRVDSDEVCGRESPVLRAGEGTFLEVVDVGCGGSVRRESRVRAPHSCPATSGRKRLGPDRATIIRRIRRHQRTSSKVG